jgi:hypothetical protein
MKRIILAVMTMIMMVTTQIGAVDINETPRGAYPSEEVTNLMQLEGKAIYPSETPTELHSEFIND